jgi:hypothetical protein
MKSPSYSKHYETLMAVVTHLAVNKWAIRQPKGIARDLSIDVENVIYVLENFKGLFRKSAGASRDHGDSYYCLHLRFARQVTDEDNNKERPPLESAYLVPLLEFVSKRASEESHRGTVMTTAMITATLSLFASLVSVALTILRTH